MFRISMKQRSLASDNNAGIHPNILAAIAAANQGHAHSYGDDDYTRQAEQEFKKIFGEQAETFFVLNGTAANVLSIKACSQSYHAVICAESAHINTDECGAPEAWVGCKLLSLPTADGKLRPEMLHRHLHNVGVQHHSQPRLISISQATECGTVYTANEVRALADFAHANSLLLHMDGARIANAAAALRENVKKFTVDAGVDILSFGGTKNGLMCGEAVVIFRRELAQDFMYIRKQGLQVASKMRFIAAQFLGYLQNDLWLKNAAHANRMAQNLYAELQQIPQVKLTQQAVANTIFAIIPAGVKEALREQYFFYDWNTDLGEVRLMTSWDTTEADVKGFVELLKKLMKN